MLAILVALTLQTAPALVGPPTPPDYRAEMSHPERRQTRQHRELLIDSAWIVGGQSLDASATIYGLHHGLSEGNRLLGSNPSNTKIVVTSAAIAAVGIVFCHEARKAGHPKIARIFAMTLGVVGGSLGAMNTWSIATHDSTGEAVYFPPQ